MNFIDKIKEKASKDVKTIVLPEATDIRVLKAAEIINKEKFAKVVLIGNEEEVKKLATENNIDLGDTKIIAPEKSEEKETYANALYELRKAKGMTTVYRRTNFMEFLLIEHFNNDRTCKE